MIVIDSGSRPEPLLDEQCAALIDNGAGERCFALAFQCEQYFLPGNPTVPLLALIALQLQRGQIRIRLSLLALTPELRQQVEALPARSGDLEALAQRWVAPWFTLGEPMALVPLALPRPWGREIRYTDVEAIGQAAVKVGGSRVPLHWLLALAPRRLAAGRQRHLIPFRQLQPWSHEPLGDLYFEVHERRSEVYLVTGVDEAVWPGAKAAMRFGLNPQKRARYGDDRRFKADYLKAVRSYEQVRRAIDQRLERWGQAQGLDSSVPLRPAQYDEALAQVEPPLLAKELERRQVMDSFCALRSVGEGDVIRVPPGTPHSLLRGVDVIELQTSQQERQILSCNHKVMNQKPWDTEQALGHLSMDTPAQHPPKSWQVTPGIQLERLAQVPGFSVFRLRLHAGESVSLKRIQSFATQNSALHDYALLSPLVGQVHYGHSPQSPLLGGDVHLVPAQREDLILSCSAAAQVLLTLPGERPEAHD